MKPFSQVIASLRGGEFDKSVAAEAEHLLRRCRDAGEKGTITITMTFQPIGDGGEFQVTPKLAVKAPMLPFSGEPGTFWLDKSGELVRTDPNQGSLDIGPGGRRAAAGNE